MEWDYTIATSDGRKVAVISKELFHMTDTYILDIADPKDALHVLMLCWPLMRRNVPETGIKSGLE